MAFVKRGDFNNSKKCWEVVARIRLDNKRIGQGVYQWKIDSLIKQFNKLVQVH